MPTNSRPNGSLAPHHQERLKRSGVSDQVREARRYATVETKADVEKLGFSRNQCHVPALVIPLYNHLGNQVGVQIRPDNPRLNQNAKPVKYEAPRNSRVVIDIPPAARTMILDPTQPLVITEGVIKADAAASKQIACAAVAGVYGWRTDDPFWTSTPLLNRTVYVAFDSDQASNPNVQKAAVRLYNALRQYGAVPKVLCLPPGSDGEKQGLDDFLARGRGVEDLFALPTFDIEAVVKVETGEVEGRYRMTPQGLVRDVVRGDEVVTEPLTNFNAWITADDEIDNGSEIRHEFEITVDLNGRRKVVHVPAVEFEQMTWVLPKLGGNAIVSAGFMTRDHVRAAIQSVSGTIPCRRLYEHLGWVKIEDRSVFLHAGGAIGADPLTLHRPTANGSGGCIPQATKWICPVGPMGPERQQANNLCGVGVRVPPALKDYVLPEPIAGEELCLAITNILSLLDQVAPPHLYLPLLAATFRIAVDTVDFSIHIVGRTNVGKTVLLGLFTQFFGAELHDRNLPGSWLSTSNSLLALMALAKNSILPIDDFVPAGSQSDIERANREADRVFRAQGNQTGRGRCTRDGTPREGRSPQCLPISTGEDVPEGHSLNSRLLTLEVKPGDVLNPSKLGALSHLQKLGRRGLFAKVMASFLAWLAPRYEDERRTLHEQREAFRSVFRESGRLARSVDIAADLLAGFDMFLDFCRELGVITEAHFNSLWETMHHALHSVLDEQKQTAEEADPVSRYLSLLVTALTTGYAHLKDQSNEVPTYRPYLWGWKKLSRTVEKEDEDGNRYTDREAYYVSQGPQIGWVNHEEVFLEIEASLAVVQKLARDSSLRPLPLTKRSLGKSLQAREFLTQTSKSHYTDKISVLGIQKRVLRVLINKLVTAAGQADTSEKSLDDLLEG